MMRRLCCLFACLLVPVGLAAAAQPPTVGGRVMYDVAVYDSDDVDLNSGGELRRARLFIKGALEEGVFYKLQYDLTGSGRDGIRDAYVGYTGVPFVDTLRIGQFSEYGSLEDTTSSKYILFMERSLPILAFVPAARRLGVGADAHGGAWYAGAGVFGEGAEVDNSEESGAGLSGRFVWMPLREARNTVHLGVSGQVRTPRGDDIARFRTRPEAHVDGTRLVDTGVISNVNQTAIYGVEAAWILGAVSLQGEYLWALVDTDRIGTENYSGAYVSASWYLTGESVAYDAASASLGRVRPLTPLGNGGFGALALACRYSTLDLNDRIEGGDEENITVGLDWHPTSKTRFMLNYVNARASVAGVDTDADIVQLRAQVDF